MMDKKKVLDSIATAVRLNAEQEIVRNTLKAALDQSRPIDQFSTWLLAGYAATAALFISNIRQISELISIESIKYCLAALIIGALFGFLEKTSAVRVTVLISVDEIIRSSLPKIIEQLERQKTQIQDTATQHNAEVSIQINMENVLTQIHDAIPNSKRLKVGKGMARGIKDPIFVYKKCMRTFQRQTIYASLEYILFIVFLLIVWFSVKI